MQDIVEIKNTDDRLMYIKSYAPDIYEKLQDKLAKITDDVFGFKKAQAIAQSFIAAFEQSGKTVIETGKLNGMLMLKRYMSKQTELKIDGKYKIIGDNCFFYCPFLEGLVFEDGVEQICARVLCKTSEIKKVKFPRSLMYIGESSFRDCENLSSVTFMNPKTVIGWMAFDGTAWLDSFKEDFVIVNGQLLIYNGSAEDVIIPEGVTCISSGAFAENKNIKSVICSSELESIHSGAFENCSSLTRVIFNDKLEVIGPVAFLFCDTLKEVTLPESIKAVGFDAFNKNVKIIYHGNNPDIVDIVNREE